MTKDNVNIKRRSSWKKEMALLPGYIIVILWILFTAVVLAWILGASLSTSREIFSGQVFKFETGFHFENYASAWKAQNVSLFFKNSLIYATVSCVAVIIIAAPAAYALSRYDFKGNRLLRYGMLLAMSIPAIMIILPLYSVTIKLGIRGRILLIILYTFTSVPYTTVYLLNFFATLSKTYEEAAAIDGCSMFRTFWKIMFPLIQPALITVTIFNFLNVWNEFFLAMIFASSEKYAPVGIGLLNIVNAMKYTGNYGGLFAAVVIVFMPTFLLYIFMSEKIIAGVTGGGVKG
ncbi:MAG: carbohydrate ABC transporter permease [Faecousia sp.]